MMATTERHDGMVRVYFLDGPRRGRYASTDIGTPAEAERRWPDEQVALAWMRWNGHALPVFDSVAYLKSCATRQLLAIRDRCYALSCSYNVNDGYGNACVTLDEVKAVLATREHVPNKAEGKAARRQRAEAARHGAYRR